MSHFLVIPLIFPKSPPCTSLYIIYTAFLRGKVARRTEKLDEYYTSSSTYVGLEGPKNEKEASKPYKAVMKKYEQAQTNI